MADTDQVPDQSDDGMDEVTKQTADLAQSRKDAGKGDPNTPMPTRKPKNPPSAPVSAAPKPFVPNTSDDAPKMHTGGVVPKTGKYTLQKGEVVIPKGRASEYRKVFEKRKKTNG